MPSSPTNAGKGSAKRSTKESWGAPNKQRGQAVLEYTLVLAVIVGIFLVAGRPALDRIRKKIVDGSRTAALGGGSGGEPNFYYYPMR